MLDKLPFSVPVNVRKLSKKGDHLKFEASEEQRELLARRYELISMDTFDAEAHVAPWRKDGVRVAGRVKASYTQPCAISGAPLRQSLDEAFDALFVPEGSKLSRPKIDGEGEIVVDAEGDDPPETFEGDTLELIEIWLEFFALGLDPFARLPKAELPDGILAEGAPLEGEDRPESPFAALAALKKP